MGRIYNFSAGPAVLPEEVLREAADEIVDNCWEIRCPAKEFIPTKWG